MRASSRLLEYSRYLSSAGLDLALELTLLHNFLRQPLRSTPVFNDLAHSYRLPFQQSLHLNEVLDSFRICPFVIGILLRGFIAQGASLLGMDRRLRLRNLLLDL